MKLYETSHTFQYPWEKVTSAIWKKYPNTNSPHIVHVETLNQQVHPHTGKLVLERLIVARERAMPKWVTTFVGTGGECYIREVIEVDSKNKTFTARSRNISGSNMLSVQEIVKYHQAPDMSKTAFVQEARFNAEGSLKTVASYAEDFCIKNFQEKAQLGLQAMENVIQTVSSERDKNKLYLIS